MHLESVWKTWFTQQKKWYVTLSFKGLSWMTKQIVVIVELKELAVKENSNESCFSVLTEWDMNRDIFHTAHWFGSRVYVGQTAHWWRPGTGTMLQASNFKNDTTSGALKRKRYAVWNEHCVRKHWLACGLFNVVSISFISSCQAWAEKEGKRRRGRRSLKVSCSGYLNSSSNIPTSFLGSSPSHPWIAKGSYSRLQSCISVSVKLLNLRQVRRMNLSDLVYLEYSSSYILSSVLEIFAVYREDLVTSKKTTVSLCDASFNLSVRERVN